MIDKLEMFIALANEGHFGRAAEACGVTQPTLSSAIKQLEDQLGVQLVFRGSRFQGLTPEGRRVLDRARRIVGDTRALRDEMRALRSGLTGTLRIGVIPTALPMVVDLTTPFTKRHPDVRVTILSRTSAEILTGIERLDLDAGITYLDNEPLGRVTQVPLYPEFYRLVCAPTLPLAQAVAALPRLQLRGVMALPAPSPDPAVQAEALAQVRVVFEQLRAAGLPLDVLSMGMSADLEAAVAQGSTMVRVGTALFGQR